jgi:hypothetical protein
VATEVATSPLSSSYKETTTTGESIDHQFDSEWESINIEPLKDINFYNHHVEQIRRNEWLTPQQLQDSIHAFAFDLKENNIGSRLKGAPINFFMGIMRKKEPYIPPTNYEDPQTRSLKTYLERKRQEEKKKEELEKEIFLLAYKEWENTLTDEDIVKIIPEAQYREQGSILRQSSLEKYFKSTQWVDIKEKING